MAERKEQQRIREFEAEAKAWKCNCGEACNPSSQFWRFNGGAWEHCHAYPIGHVPAKRQAKKVAHDTGDGWWIGEENLDGDVIKEEGIDWPKDWPDAVSAEFLENKGYEIV